MPSTNTNGNSRRSAQRRPSGRQSWTPAGGLPTSRESIDLLARHVRSCRSRELRSIMQFATEEIILPMDGGPFQGLPFSPENQPYVGLLYHELEHGRWSEIIVTGPSQSGKTLSAFVILVAYIAAELQKNVVVGIPDEKMIADKWMVDIEPVFRASPRLSKLLPITGPGSKGGTVKEVVHLRNGVVIKFMTRSGSDQSKAGFTATHVVVTEAAGWSDSTQTSKESDPLRQLRARQKATSRFDEDGNISTERQMIIEGTVTDEHDLPWRAKPLTTESVIVCPCVHCREFVTPEREHFVGFEQAADELEAAQLGRFNCPKCGQLYSEDDRRTMNRAAKLLHRGQSIDRDGTITGDPPRTSTLWFRWSAFNNLFLKQFDLAADEWKASQIEAESPDRESAERELCQQVWCIPYALPMIDNQPLRRTEIRRRRHELPPGVVPADTIHLVAGIDAGKWNCWYWVMAIRATGAMQCVLYASADTGLNNADAKSKMHELAAIKSCINRLLDTMDRGFGIESGGIRPVDLTLVDAGYSPDAVYQALRGRDVRRFLASLGRGRTQMESRRYDAPRQSNSIVRKIGERWHLEYDRSRGMFRIVFDADDSKLTIQACLRVTTGMPGSLTLPAAPEKDHTTVSRHLASEVFRRWLEPGKGVVEEWTKTGMNHYLDTAGMAYVAAKRLGWRIPDTIWGTSARPTDSDPPAAGPGPADPAPSTAPKSAPTAIIRTPAQLPGWMLPEGPQ
jgi:hypothetical protein